MKYKVSTKSGNWKYGFESVEDALVYASQIYESTGAVVAIVAYTPRAIRQPKVA